LLAIIAAAAFGVAQLMGNDGVEVPAVVGEQQATAIAKLEAAGFRTSVHEEYSDTSAEGLVTRQAPAGGTHLREGETVDLWVSKGAQTLTLVSFKGWTVKEVQAWLD